MVGRIASRYASSGTRLRLACLPRGPYHEALGIEWRPHGALQDLQREHRLEILDTADVRTLERPEYFFDTIHLNREGRVAFSAMLARHELAQPVP